MRLVSLLTCLFLLAACGGGDSPTTPAPGGGNPPPVTTDKVAATITIQAGDGQRGTPGSVLPVAPAVFVRNAAGAALANETVTFAIDSGGGSLSGAVATTGSDGVARAGSWQLSANEGRHVVRATVGALPAIRMAAAAIAADITFPAQQVPTTGGTVSLSRPGLPLDGFQLKVPAGALDAASTITLTIRSAAAVTAPVGATLLTPIVSVASTITGLNEPALVRINAPRETGFIRVALMRSAGAGSWAALPTASSDATGITVALADLAPLPSSTITTSATTAKLLFAGSDVEVVVVKLSQAITGDFDTGYRPGVDDWDFARQPIAGVPDVSPSATTDPAESMMATSIWYFLNQKAASGALYQKFQDAAGIPESNRRGLRWVGLAGKVFTAFWWQSEFATTMSTERQQNPANAALTAWNDVRIGLGSLRASSGPVPVFLFAGASNDAPKMGAVYRSAGNTLYFAIPDAPGREFQAQFDDAGKMQPFTVTAGGGGTFTVTAMQRASPINALMSTRLAAQWATVASGSIGTIAGWPAPQLRGRVTTETSVTNQNLDANDLVLGEAQTHWWKCPACATSGYQTGLSPADDHELLWRRVSRRDDGTYGALPAGIFGSASFSQQDIAPGLDAYSGFALYQPGAGSTTNNPNGKAWLDWQLVHYRRLPTSITPRNPEIVEPTDITLTGTVAGAPTGATYRWRIEEPTTPPSVTSETPTLVANTRNFAVVGPTRVILQVLEKTSRRLIAVDTSVVTLVQKPFTISPVRQVGAFGLDYTLTATYGNPTPPNASWVWDLGDGRVITTAVNAITVTYPTPTPAPTTPRTYTVKCTMKVGTATEAVATSTAVMSVPIYAGWKITSKTTTLINDTRRLDTRTLAEGNLWLNLIANHGASRPDWSALWNRYQRDSTFFYTAQSTNAAVILLQRDTIVPNTTITFQQSLYWYEYGSYPTSAITPLSAGIVGTSNTVPRGGASCNPSYSASYAPPATLTAGRATGANWMYWVGSFANGVFAAGSEPLMIFSYDVSFSGDIATGTTTTTYRLLGTATGCDTPPDVTWAYRTTFVAQRIK